MRSLSNTRSTARFYPTFHKFKFNSFSIRRNETFKGEYKTLFRIFLKISIKISIKKNLIKSKDNLVIFFLFKDHWQIRNNILHRCLQLILGVYFCCKLIFNWFSSYSNEIFPPTIRCKNLIFVFINNDAYFTLKLIMNSFYINKFN